MRSRAHVEDYVDVLREVGMTRYWW
jgi:hypothetical protein